MNALLDALNTHLPVLPVLLPSLTAILLLLLGDGGSRGHGRPQLLAARRIALGSALLGLAVAVLLLLRADAGVLSVYRLGEWPAPYGIVLVVDRLSAMMVALTALVALPLLLPLGLLTSVMGVIGALAAQSLARLVAWLTVASVGTVLAALGLYGEAAWSAALYYMDTAP